MSDRKREPRASEQVLRSLPAVDTILSRDDVAALESEMAHPYLVEVVRREIDSLRGAARRGKDIDVSPDHIAGRGIEWPLTGDEDKASSFYGLTIAGQRFGGLIAVDDLFWHGRSLNVREIDCSISEGNLRRGALSLAWKTGNVASDKCLPPNTV